LTKEQLQGWARNQFHEFRNIHRFFGGTLDRLAKRADAERVKP